MRTFLCCSLTALVLLAAMVAPASACINDRNINIQERQFRSSYQDGSQPESPSTDAPSQLFVQHFLPGAAAGFGGLLLVGGMGLVVFKARKNQA
jgi:hypothetical protein